MDVATHMAIAVTTFNQAQDLLYLRRSPVEDRALLTAAFTSRHHWHEIGGPEEKAIADWLVSRAAAATGHVEMALQFAAAALEHGDADDETEYPAWLQASLLEGLARAHTAAGNLAQRDDYITQARALLVLETDAADAALIEAQISELM
jgi:hypothetical protein